MTKSVAVFAVALLMLSLAALAPQDSPIEQAAETIGIETTTADAAATNGWIYIVAPKWWGWCPNIRGIKNRVVSVDVSNQTHGGTNRSSWGSDVVPLRVRHGSNNKITVAVGCSLGHGSSGTTINVTPGRNGQACFSASWGSSWCN